MPRRTKVSSIISIDRSIPTLPSNLSDSGWTIAEQDERSLALTEIDLSSVLFMNMLNKGETLVQGEIKLQRLKDSNLIRLDAAIFRTLSKNTSLILEHCEGLADYENLTICFDGTILEDKDGIRFFNYLSYKNGEWRKHFFGWLGDMQNRTNLSAVLK